MAREKDPIGKQPLQFQRTERKAPVVWISPAAKAPENYAPAPTKEEQKKANNGELEDRGLIGGINRFIHKHPIISTEIGVVGVSAIGAGVITAVDANRYPGIFERASENTSFDNEELVFDNNLLEVKADINNTTHLDQIAIDVLSQEDANGKPIFVFPFATRESDSIKFKREGVEKDGKILYGGIEIDTIKANTPIIAPHDGYAFVHEEDKDFVVIDFLAPNGDIYSIAITNQSASSSKFGFDIVDSIPSLSSDNDMGKEYTKGMRVYRGENLGNTTKKLSKVRIGLMRVLNGNYYETKFRTTDNMNFLEQSNKLVIKTP